MNRVLVVDDDAAVRTGLQAEFQRHGWGVDAAAGVCEALTRFRASEHSLVVTDLRMPDGDGLGLMRELRVRSPHTAVILLTAYGCVPDAVAAMRDGACDYLMKPVVFAQLERAAGGVLGRSPAADRNDPVGQAPAWLRAMARAGQAAQSDADVLIEAESGTGKELVARYIHRSGRRPSGPFVAVNCAAFPETLLESELFGHARGAFTGAYSAKPGKFEVASGGTLLLDEIGEMPLGLQPKLMRALQEREFERLGETRSVRVDLRIIATTNRSLSGMVAESKFRSDLYYRLKVIPIHLPSLRERLEDIEELAEFFVRRYSPPGVTVRLTAAFSERLRSQAWEGNVRELENFIRRAIALRLSSDLGLEEFERELEAAVWQPKAGRGTAAVADPWPTAVPNISPGMSVETMERRLYEMTLATTQGNRSRAAEMLGVSLRTVRNKIRNYGLPDWSSYVHD